MARQDILHVQQEKDPYGRVRYVGDSPVWIGGNMFRQKKIIKTNNISLQDAKARIKRNVYCTYDELLWLRNLLAYRREKLGVETRIKPIEGTEESLRELLDMKKPQHNNKKQRQTYNETGRIEVEEDEWAPKD